MMMIVICSQFPFSLSTSSCPTIGPIVGGIKFTLRLRVVTLILSVFVIQTGFIYSEPVYSWLIRLCWFRRYHVLLETRDKKRACVCVSETELSLDTEPFHVPMRHSRRHHVPGVSLNRGAERWSQSRLHQYWLVVYFWERRDRGTADKIR